MHMLFTEEEQKWIDKTKFGWPIKKGCPLDIEKSIKEKKREIDNQMGVGKK